MVKLQRLSEFQHSFSFLDQTERFDAFYDRFLQSDLGKIYLSIPWDSMVKTFGLSDSAKGPKSIFSPKGKIALMFLKHYGCCSDKRLIEQLNGNLEWQFFCDLHLGTARIENFKIVSDIRCDLANKLDMKEVEQTLYNHWSAFIDNKQSITVDATCYESHLRYPTTVKLLWECVDWLFDKMKSLCSLLGLRQPRTKYLKWKKRYVSYSKMRRKTKKKRRALTRSLLKLLTKLNDIMDGLEDRCEVTFTPNYYRRRATAKKVFQQQDDYFNKEIKPKNRIVSLDRPYIRPIVRGKEIKPVEFGAKVNKLQIDGISFVEHLSFDAFHEGNRLVDTVFRAQQLTHVKTKIMGGDAIYATNKNRNLITKHGIQTDFKRKGRATKHHKQQKKMAAAITKERASRLEGSFGKDKEHYHLKRIRARTEKTEVLWIFFGIHTGNALEIGRRIAKVNQLQAA